MGDTASKESYMRLKSDSWVECVERLAKVAAFQPQAGYVALAKSLQFEWSFVQRVIPGCGNSLERVQECICRAFWPAVFGDSVSEVESQLFSLPTKCGGLGVRNPIGCADLAFEASRSGSSLLVESIHTGEIGRAHV